MRASVVLAALVLAASQQSNANSSAQKIGARDVYPRLSNYRGEVTVAVTVTDESGNQPIECEFIWAWIPSVRPPKTETAKNDI